MLISRPTFLAPCLHTWPRLRLADLLLLLSGLVLLATGCQPGGGQATSPRFADLDRGGTPGPRLSLFLQLKEEGGPGIRMEITSLEILADDAWLPIAPQGLTIDTQQLSAGQLYLGRRQLAPGRYQRVRLTIATSSLREPAGTYTPLPVATPTIELALPSPLSLDQDDSRSLFLHWDVKGSLSEDGLRPAFTLDLPGKQMPVDLAYVSCPDINTIFVIRTDRNRVVDSFGVRGHPTYLALDPVASRQRLLVLASREAAIKVADLAAHRVIDSFRIPLSLDPSFMTVSPDGRWAYVLDERDSFLSRIDLGSGSLVHRVRLGYRPQYAAYLANQSLLAVSSALSQTVSLLDPISLAEVSSLVTGSSPQGLLVRNGLLYIAESSANTVSLYDLTSRRVLNRVAVGFGPRRLVASDHHIYVSNQEGGSISVLLPGQAGVAQEINGLRRPLEMVWIPSSRWLLVADEEEGALVVIDPTANRISGRIYLGARPQGLAVLR